MHSPSPRRTAAALTAAATLAVSLLLGGTPTAHAATARVLYVAPAGGSTDCTVAAPCSVTRAQSLVRDIQTRAPEDLTVELAGGRYELAAPLTFRTADGGRNGTTVRWAAASGQTPVLTGARAVTGWVVSDAAKNIWEAPVPVGLDTRNLFVDGRSVPRASIPVSRTDFRFTQTGFEIANDALRYLATLPQQNRLEIRAQGYFTDRYSPFGTISGTTVAMQQPAWNNNVWGYDTIPNPIFGNQKLFLENSRAFITAPGNWYIDPTAGKLYYKPADGVRPSAQDVQLPRLQSLVSISGTHAAPVTNLRFEGIQFSGTSWLGPSSSEGLASQQTGGYMTGTRSYYPADAITSCSFGCPAFERARTEWLQAPSAVQVSAARDVAFVGNRFVALGQNGLGIGNDPNAHSSGVGLGAQRVTVTGNLFTELGGGGITVGGSRADAHHPSDPAMTNSAVTLDANTILRTSNTYSDNAGILSTYVDGATITRNEVADLPYDAIDIGYGWGVNDPGGSQDYTDRGYYVANPRYTTPTTLRNNTVANNFVHDIKKVFNDGGALYSLSAAPGTVIRENYVYGVRDTVGLYLDEGSRYITMTDNVVKDAGAWVFANTSPTRNTRDNTVDNTWHMGGRIQGEFSAGTNNRITNDHDVSGVVWPAAAQAIICRSGVPAEFQTPLNTAPCGTPPAPLAGGWLTTRSAPATFTQTGTSFTLNAAAADIWGNGGQRDDAYGAVYRDGALGAQGSVSARVDQQGDTNTWAKTGVFLRNEATAAGSSPGYAVMVVTPARLASLQWDSDADGYLDSLANTPVPATGPVWVRLTRSGDQVSGSASTDGRTWTAVGGPVTVRGLAATQDAGLITSSHDTSRSAANQVSAVQIVNGIDPAWYASATSEARITQTGPAAFEVAAAGADVWGGSGQRDDAYAAVAQRDRIGANGSITAVVRQGGTHPWAKSGVALRNDFNASGTSAGYAIVVVTPSNGVAFQWDSNADGYLDRWTATATATDRPVWTRLTRSGNTVTGSWSTDGVTWTTLGQAQITGADATLDAGLLTTSHDAAGVVAGQFSQVVVG